MYANARDPRRERELTNQAQRDCVSPNDITQYENVEISRLYQRKIG